MYDLGYIITKETEGIGLARSERAGNKSVGVFVIRIPFIVVVVCIIFMAY